MILIIGEKNYDIYAYANSSKIRIAPEHPCPLIQITHSVRTEGMAGNVARNITALEHPYELITNNNWENITKTRYVDFTTSHMWLRVDSLDNVERITNLDKIEWDKYDLTLISDYCKNFLADDDLEYIAKKSKVTFIDTKRKLGKWTQFVNFVKVNDLEYNNTKDTITPEIENKIITTLGSKGARFQNKIYPVEEVQVKNLAGLGDGFSAGFCVQYVKTNNAESSIKYGNSVSTYIAQKRGISVISPEELKELNNKFNS